MYRVKHRGSVSRQGSTVFVFRSTGNSWIRHILSVSRSTLYSYADGTIDFFFTDNTTTPVANIQTAYAAQAILLEYIFRKELPVKPDVPYPHSLHDWKHFGKDTDTANITEAGFEFVPYPDATARRCAYLNSLLEDPKNGV